MRLKIRFLLFVSLTLLSFFLCILGINLWIVTSAEPLIAKNLNDLPTVDAVMVLGARVQNDGSLSWILKDRLDTALKIYREGKAKKLLLTGDHGAKQYNEVGAMKEYVRKQGIPPEDVFMDHAGFDTYDSLYRARDVFKVQSAIVVTQDFHMPRSVYIAKNLGLNVYGYESEMLHYPWYYRSNIREWLARIKAFAEISIFQSLPKYLGEEIPITGDGRMTDDKIP